MIATGRFDVAIPGKGLALSSSRSVELINVMPVPDKKEWYVVYSKPHQERFAQVHLNLKGVETFFPRLSLPRFSKKRTQIVPLFPNYLFVHVRLAKEIDKVRWAPGVKRFVSFNDIPIPLEDTIAEEIMRLANADGIIEARSDLRVGQEVRITSGPFEGLYGMIDKAPDARGRVRVLLQLLSRPVSVELPSHLVDGGWIINENACM